MNCLPSSGSAKRPKKYFHISALKQILKKLTPKYMGFKVIGKSTKEIQEGTLIDYRLSLHGVTMKWRTRIEEMGARFQVRPISS